MNLAHPPTTRRRASALLPAAIALIALAVRLLLIVALPDGREDLEIYYYYGSMMEQGLNPYTPPADGPVSPQYANISPANLGLFAAVLSLWDAPVALRVFFAIVDACIILTIGYLVQRPPPWRRAAMWFYALNPLVLMSLVIMSEDKVVVIWLTILLLVSVEAQRPWASHLLTTALTLYRWIGAFFILPVALYFARSLRGLLLSLGVFVLIVALSHIAYWPENLVVYQSRAARMMIDPPIHASPTMLLAAVGLYHPRMVAISIVGSLAILYTLFLRKRISLVETIVLSIFLTNIGAPELPFSRIVMIALPLLWLIELSQRRLLLLWIVTGTAAPFVHAHLLWPIVMYWHPAVKEVVIALLSPIPNMLLMNAFAGLLLVYYAQDRRRGVVSQATRLDDRRLRPKLRGLRASRPASPAPPPA